MKAKSGKTLKNKSSQKTGNETDKPEMSKKMARMERGTIILFVLLLIIITVKSTVLDEVKDLSPAEQQFKDFVEYSVDRDHNGILEDTRLLVYRVVDIKMADKEQNAVLRYEEPKTGEMVEVIQDGRYQAKVRAYLLWIMPFKEFSVTAEIKKQQ